MTLRVRVRQRCKKHAQVFKICYKTTNARKFVLWAIRTEDLCISIECYSKRCFGTNNEYLKYRQLKSEIQVIKFALAPHVDLEFVYSSPITLPRHSVFSECTTTTPIKPHVPTPFYYTPATNIRGSCYAFEDVLGFTIRTCLTHAFSCCVRIHPWRIFVLTSNNDVFSVFSKLKVSA